MASLLYSEVLFCPALVPDTQAQKSHSTAGNLVQSCRAHRDLEGSSCIDRHHASSELDLLRMGGDGRREGETISIERFRNRNVSESCFLRRYRTRDNISNWHSEDAVEGQGEFHALNFMMD